MTRTRATTRLRGSRGRSCEGKVSGQASLHRGLGGLPWCWAVSEAGAGQFLKLGSFWFRILCKLCGGYVAGRKKRGGREGQGRGEEEEEDKDEEEEEE
jgi:hypothetical protein